MPEYLFSKSMISTFFLHNWHQCVLEMKNFSFNYVFKVCVILTYYSIQPKHRQLSKNKWVVCVPSQSKPVDPQVFSHKAKNNAVGAVQDNQSTNKDPLWLWKSSSMCPPSVLWNEDMGHLVLWIELSPEKICWSSNPWYVQVWYYVEMMYGSNQVWWGH